MGPDRIYTCMLIAFIEGMLAACAFGRTNRTAGEIVVSGPGVDEDLKTNAHRLQADAGSVPELAYVADEAPADPDACR